MNHSSEDTEQISSKAGRHRLYSNEQRKDRNRQAQAAFRDRRSKYTKTLEAAMLKYEDTIESLKEDNNTLIQRAEAAEQRSTKLDSEVANLQKLLQMALAENQRILSSK
jgi:phage shock protein A